MVYKKKDGQLAGIRLSSTGPRHHIFTRQFEAAGGAVFT